MIGGIEKIVSFPDNNTINAVDRKVDPVHSVTANFDSILKDRLRDSDGESGNKYVRFLLEEGEKVNKKDTLGPAVIVDIPNLEGKVKTSIDNILLYNAAMAGYNKKDGQDKLDSNLYNKSNSNNINPYEKYTNNSENSSDSGMYA